ncbi:acetylxylan esterase [Deinococcus sonorensis]|uniref:Acetylxylan esterase n=2 Tax=Deinococcus sonorensis TaxID=309891 RepID=A0AAU7UGW0_9DEIO
MAHFDLPLDELERYLPDPHEPADFQAFWDETLTQARALAGPARFEPTDTPLSLLEVLDVTFSGYGGDPVRGWLVLPRQRRGPLPCVVEYIGYGGGRGQPHEWLLYASAGYAHFIMDTRGQGSAWRTGDTADRSGGGEPHLPGFMTQGIQDRQQYYYRRVYTDAALAIAAARQHPAIDPARVAVTGGSQGGGLALAASGLVPDVAACLPDVPFLCHFERAIRITDSLPYGEIAQYLRIHRDQAGRAAQTLRYFDGLQFARRAQAPALFSVGLMDDICPPSTVYAAYNHYAGPKAIEVYPFNRHEGGQAHQDRQKLAFLNQVLPLNG